MSVMLLSGLEAVAEQLQNTLSDDAAKRTLAESYLKQIELEPSYPVILLRIITDSGTQLPVRLSASVAFKNFIRKYWSPDVDTDDRIQIPIRDTIREQILGAVVSVSGCLQPQLSEAIAIIWRADFPHKWPSLIPELVERIARQGGNLELIIGLLQTTHTLFERYRHECAGDDLFREMKTVIQQFGQPLTELTQHLVELLCSGSAGTNPGQFDTICRCTLFACKIFLSLNCQDLPEFFEDNMETWMTLFHKLLQLNSPFPQPSAQTDSSLIDQIKSQVCDNISLYASKYGVEFASYLPGFVTDVWELLVQAKADCQNDAMIGNAIDFLASVVARPQHRHLFERPEALQSLCEKVVLPNMRFRASDEELFSENPDEYIRLDLEDSDSHTPRHAACHLVHALCQAFEGPVIENFSKYIESLLLEYANSPNGSAWVSKDAALLLVTSVAARGKTEKLGVTMSTKLVNIASFFQMHVLPEFQTRNVNHLPVIKADCIRYAIAFRGLLQPQDLVRLVNLVPSLLSSESVVVVSYAAVLLDKLLAYKVPESQTEAVIHKEHIENPDLLTGRLLSVLSSENGDNPYVIRALLRTCCVLEERCLPLMNSIMSCLLPRLVHSAKNPCKPSFNHCLLETICLCIRITCDAKGDAVTQFESALFPIFQDILQNDSSDLIPYVFQLLSVLLEQYPLSERAREMCISRPSSSDVSLQPSPPYAVLLPRLLVPALWDQRGFIPTLARLLHSYLLHDMAHVSMNQLSTILGAYQRMVGSSLYDAHSFVLLDALVIASPMESLEPYLRQVFMLIFKRLQSSKTEKFMKAFVWFISRFVLLRSPNALVKLVDGVQQGLFSRVLEKVLVPYAEATISSHMVVTGFGGGKSVTGTPLMNHWRQVSVGLTRLIFESDDILGPKGPGSYFGFWAPLVNGIIGGLMAGPGRLGGAAAEVAVRAIADPNSTIQSSLKGDRFTDIDLDTSGCQAVLGQLAFASRDLPQFRVALVDPRIFLANALHQLAVAHPTLVGSSLKPTMNDQIANYLQQCLNLSGVRLP